MQSIFFSGSKLQIIRWLLLIMIGVLLIFWSPLPAGAAVTQTEEYPGQMLYQSRQNLLDQTGQSWQVIAFKRIHPEGSAIVSLRLVGFPGAVALDHTQPLTMTTSLGKTLIAPDISNEISRESPALANVAEYDIQSVLLQLEAPMSLQLTLPVVTGLAIKLQIPFTTIQEWQTIAVR